MLHVNEDTNDELFRKAAEDYFLGTGNPEWETFLNKMNTGDASLHETAAPKKKRHFPLLFLFNGSRSIFRLFRFSLRPTKGKKKIEYYFLPGNPEPTAMLCLDYRYFYYPRMQQG